MHFFGPKCSIFCHHRCIRKIINSLPLRRKLLRNFLLRVRSNKHSEMLTAKVIIDIGSIHIHIVYF
jgi:hypothetical protein